MITTEVFQNDGESGEAAIRGRAASKCTIIPFYRLSRGTPA